MTHSLPIIEPDRSDENANSTILKSYQPPWVLGKSKGKATFLYWYASDGQWVTDEWSDLEWPFVLFKLPTDFYLKTTECLSFATIAIFALLQSFQESVFNPRHKIIQRRFKTTQK